MGDVLWDGLDGDLEAADFDPVGGIPQCRTAGIVWPVAAESFFGEVAEHVRNLSEFDYPRIGARRLNML
jgi:hypothetical protein